MRPASDAVAEAGEGVEHLVAPPRSSRARFQGPIAASVAPTASAPRATMPAAKPRQPQCSIATPPGPESATGTQSATKTSSGEARLAQ